MINKKIPCIYGDFVNEEILEKIDIKNTDMIISTIPDTEDNLVLIKKIREFNKDVPLFVVANRIDDALDLYETGADYVIIPQIVAGQKVSEIIRNIKKNKKALDKLKKDHLSYLKEIHRILY